MGSFEQIMQITGSDLVQEGVDLPKVHMHKWLALGQTEFVCRYGTLSDGHEKILDSQKYPQAIKELYNISNSLADQECDAMEAQADLIEAEEVLSKAQAISDKYRATARVKRAKNRLSRALVLTEDLMRQAKVYYQVYTELKPKVEAQYPGGLEQAELDNWKAVAKYRMIKQSTPGLSPERLDNIPLPSHIKAEIGYLNHRPDAVAPLAVESPEYCKKLELKVNSLLEERK